MRPYEITSCRGVSFFLNVKLESKIEAASIIDVLLPAVLQETLCYGVDSLTTLCRLGKSSGSSAVDTRLLLKGSIFYQFSDVYFLSPATAGQQNCMINYSKRRVRVSASAFCWEAEKRPAVAVRCRHPFVMSHRADFHCSVYWYTVEEADWMR